MVETNLLTSSKLKNNILLKIKLFTTSYYNMHYLVNMKSYSHHNITRLNPFYLFGDKLSQSQEEVDGNKVITQKILKQTQKKWKSEIEEKI